MGNGFVELVGVVVVIGILIALGTMTLGNIQSTQTENSTEYNATTKGVSAMTSYSNFTLPLVYLVMAVIIIAFTIRLGKTRMDV